MASWHEYGKGLAERLSDLHGPGSERSVPGASVAAGRRYRAAGRGEHDRWASPQWRTRLSSKAVAETILLPIYEPEPSSDSASKGSDPDVAAHDASTPWLSG